MRILLLGAAGFIGRELLAHLVARGHRVTAVVRRRGAMTPMGAHAVFTLDLNRATDPADWAELVDDCDAVVNCAGVLQGTRSQSIDAIHAQAPVALFRACEAAGGRRVVQISAISAEPQAGTAYATTKRTADDFLRGTTLEWTVIRPSLVVARGAQGGTALFRALASLPFAIPVPEGGEQEFQPIHVDDVARTVSLAIEEDRLLRKTVDPVGPEAITLRRILEDYRRWLGHAPARVISIPRPLVRIATWLGDLVGGPINSTSAAQMKFGNTGNAEAFERAVGFTTRRWRDLLAQHPAHTQDRWHAALYFVRPVLRISLAALWIFSGIAGAFAPLPQIASTIPVGSTQGMVAILAILCAADILIGVLVAMRWRPKLMTMVQLGMVSGYTVAASILFPELWADPLGALLKNLPILGAILALGAIEEER